MRVAARLVEVRLSWSAAYMARASGWGRDGFWRHLRRPHLGSQVLTRLLFCVRHGAIFTASLVTDVYRTSPPLQLSAGTATAPLDHLGCGFCASMVRLGVDHRPDHDKSNDAMLNKALEINTRTVHRQVASRCLWISKA